MTDTRIVYGATCAWWDSIAQVGKKPSGLPCCPHCGGMLFEIDSETKWWEMVDQYDAVDPDYRKFIEWQRGQCFPSYQDARAAFDQAKDDDHEPE